MRAAERRFRRCSRSDGDRQSWTDKLKEMRLYEENNNNYWRSDISQQVKATRGKHDGLSGVYWTRLPQLTLMLIQLTTLLPFSKAKSRQFERLPLRHHDVPYRSSIAETPTITEWSNVTNDEVEKLISSAPNKTCQSKTQPLRGW